MMDDVETWLIDAGDEIIRKKASIGIAGLSEVERAILCLWVVDYAVRNSGTLHPMRALYPDALVELHSFAISTGLSELAALTGNPGDETAFCADYHGRFETAGTELRQCYCRA